MHVYACVCVCVHMLHANPGQSLSPAWILPASPCPPCGHLSTQQPEASFKTSWSRPPWKCKHFHCPRGKIKAARQALKLSTGRPLSLTLSSLRGLLAVCIARQPLSPLQDLCPRYSCGLGSFPPHDCMGHSSLFRSLLILDHPLK